MDELISFLKDKRNLINLLTLGIIVLALPIGVNLVRQQQIFTSRAASGSVEFLTKEKGGPSASDGTSCVSQRSDGTWSTKCNKVKIWITAPSTLTAKAPEFVSKVYAAACASISDSAPPNDGWQLIEASKCDPNNPGNAGQYWVCFDDNGAPAKERFEYDAPNSSCGGGGGGGGGGGSNCFLCSDGSFRQAGDKNDCNGAPSCPSLSSSNNACTSSTNVTGQSCGSSTGTSGCVAAVSVDNGRSWPTEVKDGVNKGDTNLVSVRTTSKDSAVSNAKLFIKDPGGTEKEKTDWTTNGYYIFDQAGTYTLTAKGGSCSSESTATVKVVDNSSGGNNNCYVCRGTSFGRAGDPNDCKGAPTCPKTSSGNNACTSDSDYSNKPCGSPAPSASTPTGVGTTGKITSFRVSENPNSFAGGWQDYKDGGVAYDVTFSNNNPGEKLIYVQFMDDKGQISNPLQVALGKITLLSNPPQVSNLYCNYDIQNDVLKLIMGGSNFDSKQGSITANGQDLSGNQIDSWSDTAINARINRPQNSVTGSNVRIKVKKSDGQSDESTCSVNVSQINLGAKWMCGVANTYDIPNTTLSIFAMPVNQNIGVGTTASSGSSKANETVTISKDGTIKNIKTQLNQNAPYKICVKPPLGIRTCSDQFNFSTGTTMAKLDIPIGDLNGDGVINNLDAAILRQQFGVGSGKTADFLQKGSVNSFDWGCMIQNFNKSNTPEPF